MCGFYPAIIDQELPVDYILTQMNMPWLRYVFQIVRFDTVCNGINHAGACFNQRTKQYNLKYIAQYHRWRTVYSKTQRIPERCWYCGLYRRYHRYRTRQPMIPTHLLRPNSSDRIEPAEASTTPKIIKIRMI